MVQDFKKRENVIRRHFSQQERCVSQSGSSYKELIFKIFSTFKFQKKNSSNAKSKQIRDYSRWLKDHFLFRWNISTWLCWLLLFLAYPSTHLNPIFIDHSSKIKEFCFVDVDTGPCWQLMLNNIYSWCRPCQLVAALNLNPVWKTSFVVRCVLENFSVSIMLDVWTDKTVGTVVGVKCWC